MGSLLNRLGASSLAARVAVGVAFLLAFGGVIVSIAAFAYGREAARSAYDRLLVGAANDIASAIYVVEGRPVLELPHSAFELLALAPDDRIGYRITGPDGATLTGYDEIELPENLSGFRDVFFDAPFFGEIARFVVVSRRFAERSWNGTVRIAVGQTLHAREAMAIDITRKALYVLAVSGITMLLLAVLVVHAVFRPLNRIAKGLASRDPHDLTPLDTSVPRETAVMIQALNGFMGRLDRQMNSMRHLVSDTAHQLRTPVAALRAQADLFADETDPQRQQRIVERIQARSASLGRLLDQMLSQALVIHRGDSARREVIDLRDVALDVFEGGDHEVLTPELEVTLALGDHPVTALADAPSLQEALKNLFSNALKYGRGPIRIGASEEGGAVSLWVEDNGGGPDPDVIAAVGTRFQRVDSIRRNSSGLGLAIAHSVANSFQGQLVLETRNGTTFRAALIFPAVEVSP